MSIQFNLFNYFHNTKSLEEKMLKEYCVKFLESYRDWPNNGWQPEIEIPDIFVFYLK
jgi:hypothetical protein